MKRELFYADHIYASNHLGAPLQGLSLSLYDGEILGLYGDRHAGKGALFRVMTGTIPLTGGTIRWNGKAGSPPPKIDRVNKYSRIIGELNVWENMTLLLGPQIMGSALNSLRQKRMVRLYLEDYGLDFDMDQQCSALSQLERMCMEVLVALRHGVKVLIVDLNGIEGTAREYAALKTLLERLRREGVTLIVSSYQAEIISLLSDRIAVIYGGRILKAFAASQITAQELQALTLKLYHVQTEPAEKPQGEQVCVLRIDDLGIGQRTAAPLSFYRGEFSAIVSPRRDIFQLLQDKVRRDHPHSRAFFLDAQHLGELIVDMTPLENLCLRITDQAGRFGFESKRAMACVEQDFYEWYGHEGLLRQSDSRFLYKKHRVAINLFRLRFLKVDVIFCNAPNVHSDMVSYQMVKKTLMELAREGISTCMITDDISCREETVDRYIILDEGR